MFTQPQETLETSGNVFLRICSVAAREDDRKQLSSDQTMAITACINYVNGFADGVDAEMRFVMNATKQSTHGPFCLPEGVKEIQMVRVVLKYIRDNPAAARRNTKSLIMFSLGERYPCPDH